MDIQCPKCFSKKYTKMGSQDYKCKDCGHTYDVDDMKAAMSKDDGEKFRKAPGKQHENIISKIDKYLGEADVCPKCGSKALPDGYGKCTNCGKKLPK